jgi:Flp pilus assembly protein CpaB
VARSNRLLVAGGIVTLLGAALVLAVLYLQRDATPVAAQEPPPAEEVQAAQQTAPPPFEIPEGLEAVAVTVDFERSVAALPQAGDRVNVYVVFRNVSTDAVGTLPAVRRILADVPVLAITGASHSSNTGTPTVVLGLDPADVEAAIYLNVVEDVYFSLVQEDTEESPETSGANAGTIQP